MSHLLYYYNKLNRFKDNLNGRDDKINLFEALKSMDPDGGSLGGGAASALAGAMAANIISMVARLSLGKNCGLDDKEYEAIMKKANNMEKELRIGAIKDDEAYGMIAAAYKLPKSNDTEKNIRLKAIGDAAYCASKIPGDNAGNCHEVNKLGKYLVGKSNLNAYTDLQIAILLSHVGKEGCIMNVEVNMPLIKNEHQIEELKKIIDSLM